MKSALVSLPIASLVLALSSCNEARTPLGVNAQTNADLVVRFFDGFDDDIQKNWILSSPNDAEKDASVGRPTAPSLLMRDRIGVNTATLKIRPFQGFDMRVSVSCAPPNDATTCQGSQPLVTPMVEIINKLTGEAVAGVDFQRSVCADPTLTRFVYWVGTPNSAVFVEQMASGSVTGQFFDFVLRVNDRGDSTWSRDGVKKLVVASGVGWPFDNSIGLSIRLSPGHGSPRLPIRFDSVRIETTD
jgi:hypothetical protein